MAMVYVIQDDGSTVAMSRIRCKNEDRELQRILERNPDLLPGDQIDPDDPRRWLLLKREMPVPDPRTGGDRWAIDFLFADQDAMPTFVECKRCADTRARREIVGQMLEYAANGHHFWTAESLREVASRTAAAAGSRIVVPTLFGYTEEARRVKEQGAGKSSASRRRWDRESYFADAASKLTPEQVKTLESLLDYFLSLGCEVTWGTGIQKGSFNVKEPLICPRSLFTCYSNGDLTFNLFWLNGSELALHAQHRLKELAGKKLNLQAGAEDRPIAVGYWVPRSQVVTEVVQEVVSDCRKLANTYQAPESERL